jgi:phosphoribosylaminoimidazolecarboxamide formyltransferase/IMP cyclohydrolase
MTTPRRALLSVSDKTGLVELGRGLVTRRFELVSTGGTARALRDAGLPVTDVASVTGSPEMLDGRVKTLHPRVHGGLLADRRLADHRRQLLAAGIAPFELVVVNLYPFAAALERPGITIDELIEEIDIGGPSMVRAAAKNHANVAIVTSPVRYADVLAALDTPAGLDDRLRRELALEAFAHTAAYDARIASELPRRLVDAGLLDAPEDPYPATLSIALEKVETLRYGENPHQPAARYRRPGSTIADGPFGVDRPPLQGKSLSYNNVLDAAAAAALGRALRGPAVVIVKHTNPCGAAERSTLLEAWAAALEADPVSAFGGVVALTREVDRSVAEALTSIFLEIVVAPAYGSDALEVLGNKPNLRVLVDEALAADEPLASDAISPTGSIRTAGGAVLVTAPDVVADTPSTWTCATERAPTTTGAVGPRPRVAAGTWRDVERHRARAGRAARGDGQRPDLTSGRRATGGRQGARDTRCRLDGRSRLCERCVLPVPDAVEVCLDAGVQAFVQPGGSMRDAEVVDIAERRDATMLITGVRHFRH